MPEPSSHAENACCNPSRGTASVGPSAGGTMPSVVQTAGGDADHPSSDHPASDWPTSGRPSPAGTSGMVLLPGGVFVMGSDDRFAYPDDGETSREVEISPFMIDSRAVSNAAFAEFVAATGHVTE